MLNEAARDVGTCYRPIELKIQTIRDRRGYSSKWQ